MNEYEKIKVWLSAAKESYAREELTAEEYIALLEDIKAHFEAVQKKIEEEKISRILNKFINDLP